MGTPWPPGKDAKCLVLYVYLLGLVEDMGKGLAYDSGIAKVVADCRDLAITEEDMQVG